MSPENRKKDENVAAKAVNMKWPTKLKKIKKLKEILPSPFSLLI